MKFFTFIILSTFSYSQNLSTFNQSFYSGFSKTAIAKSYWYNPIQLEVKNSVYFAYSKFNHGSDFSDYFVAFSGNYNSEINYFFGYRENKIESTSYILLKESWLRSNLVYEFSTLKAAVSFNYFMRNWEIINYNQNFLRLDLSANYRINNLNLSVIFENVNQNSEFPQNLIFSISFQHEMLTLAYSQFDYSEFVFEYSFNSEVNGLVKLDLFEDRIDYSLGFRLNINLFALSYFYEIQSVQLIDNKHQLFLSVDL
jgi:hypothetical protein